jgi:SAM-dependent methyltransferase
VTGEKRDRKPTPQRSGLPCLCGPTPSILDLGRQGAVLRCPACGLLARTPLPAPEELDRWYRDEYWTRYRNEQVGDARRNLHAHVLSRLGQLLPDKGTVVDVGCGGGGFLAACRNAGWPGIGYDPSVHAVEFAVAQGLDVRVQSWPPSPLGNGAADAVTLINVLDHLCDPFDALDEAWRVLRLGGVLYVRVPNGPLHVRLMTLPSFLRLDHLAVLHLYGFGRRTFLHHLRRLGFGQITVRTSPPTAEDAYHEAADRAVPMRSMLKAVDRRLYRILAGHWLRERAWGPSIEAMAVKGHRASVHPDPIWATEGTVAV